MIRFAVKAGIAGSAIYYLSKEGVWQESTESLKVYDKLKESLGPYLQQIKAQIPIEIPPLPESNQISYVTKQYWNQGVLATFKFLTELPDHVSSVSKKGYESLMENPEVRKMMDSLTKASPTETKNK